MLANKLKGTLNNLEIIKITRKSSPILYFTQFYANRILLKDYNKVSSELKIFFINSVLIQPVEFENIGTQFKHKELYPSEIILGRKYFFQCKIASERENKRSRRSKFGVHAAVFLKKSLSNPMGDKIIIDYKSSFHCCL